MVHAFEGAPLLLCDKDRVFYVLPVKKHTIDTHGYTEIIFALCYLLGYDFMPRIRDLKDQQLYRIDKYADYGVFDPLLTKSADVSITLELWQE